MLKKMSLNKRIWLAVMLPVLLLTLLGTYTVYNNVVTFREVAKLDTLVHLAPHVSSLVHELQKERGASAGYIGQKAQGDFREKLTNQHHQTTAVYETFLEEIRRFPIHDYDKNFSTQIENILPKLQKLSSTRENILNLTSSVPDMAKYYTSTIAQLLDIIGVMTTLSNHAEMNKNITTYLSLLQAKERQGQERAMGAALFSSENDNGAIHNKFINILGQQEAFMKIFHVFATKAQQETYEQIVKGSEVDEIARMRHILTSSDNDEQRKGTKGSYWFDMITHKINLVKEVEDSLAQDLVSLVDDQQTSTKQLVFFWVVLVLIMLILNIAICYILVHGALKSLENLSNAFRAVFEQVQQLTEDMKEVTSTLAASAEETNAQVAVVKENSSQASSNADSVAAAVEEMDATIHTIKNSAGQTADKVQEAVQEASKTSEVVSHLGDASKKISEVINIINDIADQINLLALNAAIEAARAGDAGKGFAVVADEVKKLAEGTSRATDDIAKYINDISTVSQDSATAIDKIRSAVEMINETITSVTSSVEEQTCATRDISQSINDTVQRIATVDNNITGIDQATNDTAIASSELMEASNRLSRELGQKRQDVDNILKALGLS